nr:MAG TPA: hypothetical protein [Caudoviricetes sp.]
MLLPPLYHTVSFVSSYNFVHCILVSFFYLRYLIDTPMSTLYSHFSWCDSLYIQNACPFVFTCL